MSDITVSLDTNADPAVTCTPWQYGVDPGNGKVKWNKGGGNQDFEFYSLSIADPPFSLPPVYEHGKWVVVDANTHPDVYTYELKVRTPDGHIYSTKKTHLHVRGGGDSVPCIKNN